MHKDNNKSWTDQVGRQQQKQQQYPWLLCCGACITHLLNLNNFNRQASVAMVLKNIVRAA
jgi:hypothetical protein